MTIAAITQSHGVTLRAVYAKKGIANDAPITEAEHINQVQGETALATVIAGDVIGMVSPEVFIVEGLFRGELTDTQIIDSNKMMFWLALRPWLSGKPNIVLSVCLIWPIRWLSPSAH